MAADFDDWMDRPHTRAELVARIEQLREQHRAIIATAQARADQCAAAFRDAMTAATAAMDQAQAARDAADRVWGEYMGTIVEVRL